MLMIPQHLRGCILCENGLVGQKQDRVPRYGSRAIVDGKPAADRDIIKTLSVASMISLFKFHWPVAVGKHSTVKNQVENGHSYRHSAKWHLEKPIETALTIDGFRPWGLGFSVKNQCDLRRTGNDGSSMAETS